MSLDQGLSCDTHGAESSELKGMLREKQVSSW